MRQIGNFYFPESKEEAKQWKHVVRIHALHQNVLCVAHTRIEGTWCAYCGPVLGIRHSEEHQDVLEHGDKLSEKIALAIFLDFEGIPYAR